MHGVIGMRGIIQILIEIPAFDPKVFILKTAVGTYEKPFVLMYRSMNGFSYVHPLGFAPKPVHPSIHQGERALEPRNCGF